MNHNITVYRNFSQILTLEQAWEKDGRNLIPQDCSIIENATVVFDTQQILWVGKDSKLPKQYQTLPQTNYTGKVLLPELVDSHTHLIFAGDRSKEYAMRLNGADYQEIGKAGGGILNTMHGTNNISDEKLFNLCSQRIEQIYKYGIGTIEIKSGYGLGFEQEYRLSTIIHKLKQKYSPKIQIINTYMAAHAVPKQFPTSSNFMQQIVLPLLKKLAPLNIIDTVDIFHEQNYFTSQDVEQLFALAQQLNIPRKIHADEFNDNQGATLATNHNALSADHLLMISDPSIQALANSTTVATLLPGTAFFLGKQQVEAKKLLDAGVKVAIASDYNPGSSHCDNLLLLASLAAPQYKMNIAQLFTAITLNAAHALNLKQQGAIIPKLKPRFSIFDTDKIDKITYNWGKNLSLNNQK